MSAILPDPRLDVQRKQVAASLRADRKALAVDWRQRQADVFQRILALGHMELKALAHELGYADQSAVSRWASGAERPQFDRVASVDRLRPWIAVAWGEATGAEVQVSVTVRRLA